MGKSQGPLTVLASPCERQPALPLPELLIRIGSTISAFTPWPRPVKISTHDPVSIMARRHPTYCRVARGNLAPQAACRALLPVVMWVLILWVRGVARVCLCAVLGVKWRVMSMRALPPVPVPKATARVTRAAFPQGCLAMRLRDAFGALYQGQDFVDLFARIGGPSRPPGMSALVSVLCSMRSGYRTGRRRMRCGPGSIGSTRSAWS